jgi:hypothetical protein
MFFPKTTHTREEFLPKGNMCEKKTDGQILVRIIMEMMLLKMVMI